MEETLIDLANLEAGYDFEKNVTIDNELLSCDFDTLMLALENSRNLDKVEGVLVDYDAQIDSLSFLSFFTNLHTLVLLGKGICSLDGLASQKKLKNITLDFTRKRGFDFSPLYGKSYDIFRIRDLSKQELEMFSFIPEVRELILISGDYDDLSFLNNTKVFSLDIHAGKFDYLKGLETLKCCENVAFIDCRKMVGITTNIILNLHKVEFETCNKINLDKLRESISCVYLRIASCKYGTNIVDLCNIPRLEILTVSNSNITIDLIDFNIVNLDLREVMLTPIPSCDLESLKELYSNINWSTC